MNVIKGFLGGYGGSLVTIGVLVWVVAFIALMLAGVPILTGFTIANLIVAAVFLMIATVNLVRD